MVGGKPNCVKEIFDHFIPSTWLYKLTTTANIRLLDDPTDKTYRKTSMPEMEAVLGMALAASVAGFGAFEGYFSTAGVGDDSCFAGAGFGQFGINKNRAVVLLRFAHLSDGPEQPDGADQHWFIDGPCGEFNAHMAKVFKAGYLACMDESGPPWHGAEGEGNYNKNPHTTVCKRKPEPICAQFNDSGCALSDVMTYIEFEKAAGYTTQPAGTWT